MFKDSYVTKLTPWQATEESAGMPVRNYPAFIGTGLMGIGLDTTGLQALPDKLASFFGCKAAPFQVTQSDLYILHEGLISEHLYHDEVALTDTPYSGEGYWYGRGRNYMPLGYVRQKMEYGGKTLEAEAIAEAGSKWRREWSLRHGIVTNLFYLERRIPIETTIFAPHGGETIYIKLRRGAEKSRWGRAAGEGEGDFTWTVEVPFETRHGLKIYDQPNAVTPAGGTVIARIDEKSSYKPSEAYAIVYGIAADGAEVKTSSTGLIATMAGQRNQEQTAWLRLDFRRLAGDDCSQAEAVQQSLKGELDSFTESAATAALDAHRQNFEMFWASVADVEVEQPDAAEVRRQYMLHMSEYLCHCGNDYSYGGNVQFLLNHQNGWGASNFHDNQYITDGIARANMFDQAEANARWMRTVMHPSGRAFPWMMTYDGYPTAAPEQDRAPMSDSNRALLAMRIYEMAGKGREELLSEVVYPILKQVADMSIADWFYEDDGRLLFKGTETDVTGDEAKINDTSTVLTFLSVIRKTLEYSRKLNVDSDRHAAWEDVLQRAVVPVEGGRYVPHLNATAESWPGPWLRNIYYIAEAGEYLDDEIYARTCDRPFRSINFAWIGSAAASSELKLGRPDRAEQLMNEILENTIHGPGYFEECEVGPAALPPFGTAHGAHLVASCEQAVRPDFWHHRVFVCTGLPSKLRASKVTFRNIRARDGLIVSGVSEPRRLEVNLHHTGDPVEMELILAAPCEIPVYYSVKQDGVELPHVVENQTAKIRISLQYDQKTTIVVE